MSKALALRGMALQLAARTTVDLNLTPLSEIGAALRGPICTAAAEMRTILLLGASTRSLFPGLRSTAAGESRSLTIIEPEAALLEACLPSANPGCETSIRPLAGDPSDLRIDPRAVDRLVAETKPVDYGTYAALRLRIAEHASASPLVPTDSVDLVVIDMLVNRLAAGDMARVLAEALRVLRRGGRLMFAALLADEPLPSDTGLDFGPWRAVRLPTEAEAGGELAAAGLHGITYHALLDRPLRVVKGVEVRAYLLDGYKGKQGICLDQGDAVIYRGPWREVLDDDGHRYVRGERTAVCAKTHDLLMRRPYAGNFVSMPPYVRIPLDQAPLFDCRTPALRDPSVTKGKTTLSRASGPAAGGSDACCGPASGDGSGAQRDQTGNCGC